MFAMAVIPAATFGIGLIFIPDSPRWLAGRGHLDQARAVLKRIRPPDKVEAELNDIQHSVAQQKGNWSELLSPLLRSAMIVGIGLGGWLFAFFLVPETKGKTLEQIEVYMRSSKHPRAL